MTLANTVDALATRLPDADPHKAEIRSRIADLADECGCTMGGAFGVLAAAAATGHFVLGSDLTAGSAGVAIGLVLVTSFVGKLVGLGVARLRLLRLRRVLAGRLATGEVPRVHVH